MSLAPRLLSISGYSFVLSGIALGILGSVRIGAILIAIGSAGVSLSAPKVSKVGRYLPLAIAVALFAMAVALPRGR